MPTYQYACTACGHRFDAVQSFSDAALTECPECSGRLRKLFGSVGVVFKGSGFYRTDSRASADGEGKKSAAKKEPASSGESGSSGKTDTSSPGSSSGSSSSGSSSSGSSSSAGSSGSTGGSSTTPAAKAS